MNEIRTQKQNNAYWVFQEQVANEMNNQGIAMKDVIEVFEIMPTKESLHEFIFKRILLNKFQKTSTTKMNKDEMNACLDDYMYILSTLGLEIDFPDERRQKLLEFYDKSQNNLSRKDN